MLAVHNNALYITYLFGFGLLRFLLHKSFVELESYEALRHPPWFAERRATEYGFGTRTRTWIDGTKTRCPTIRRSRNVFVRPAAAGRNTLPLPQDVFYIII
jgi:hypothetical protein